MSNNNDTKKPLNVNDLNAEVNARLKPLPSMGSGSRKLRAYNRCECGCPGLTQSRFVVGHDAKLHARVIRVQRGLWARGGDVWAQLEACKAWYVPEMGEDVAHDIMVATAIACGIDVADWPVEEADEKVG